MEKLRYMISDAANIVHVEAHVLRYWEEELELTIPRNEMGHRYYTRENIQEFQKIKELKEKGYQLKAIRMILHSGEDGLEHLLQAEASPKQAYPAAKDSIDPVMAVASGSSEAMSAEDRMAQFRELMSDIVGHAISLNNEELSMQIGQEVQERVLKEMNYLAREQEEAQEERYKKLDAAIRGNVRKKRAMFSKEKKEKEPKPVKEVKMKRSKKVQAANPVVS